MNNVNSVDYGERTISFCVLYSERKTLEISVLPDSSVEVKAPQGASMDAVAAKVKQRAAWIVEKQNWFAKFPKKKPPRQYMSGETHMYLGRHYRLKVNLLRGDAVSKPVKISGGFIFVSAKKDNPLVIKALLDEWLRKRAKSYFEKVLAYYRDKYAVSIPLRMQVRYMKTRWGSLSKGGVLTLNSGLIAAPRECIEYVVIHELCHLKYNDHGKAFYRLLEQRLPDWEKRKDKLERL